MVHPGAMQVSLALLSSYWLAHEAPAPSSRIMGGEPAKACTWPTTVSIKHCTATLIHPRVLIYAAHCGDKVPEALFGESTDKPSRRVKTKYCKTNPDFSMSAGPGKGTDFAFCVLESAVEDMPLAPILYGCEVEKALVNNADIWLAGFGKNNNESGGPKSGIKHWVKTDFVKFKNSEKKEVVVGSNGKTACNGDSGGPAYIQLEDGTWRTFGITSHGEDTSCTKVAYYTHAAIMVPWMQEFIHRKGDKDIDVTPCFDDDGTWNPSKDCGGFAKDYETAYGDWKNYCSEGAPLSGASATCGDPNPDAGDVEDKDDSNNTIKIRFKAPKADTSFEEGEAIEVKIDADKDDLEVELFVNGSSVSVDDKAPFSWTLEELEPGQHELLAKAKDDDKNSGSTKTLTISVTENEKDNSDDPDPSQESSSPDTEDSTDPEDTSPKDTSLSKNPSGQEDPKASGSDPTAGKGSGCRTSPGNLADLWLLFAFSGLLTIKRDRR